MRTEKQQQASRDNGAKSHGPSTPEGKAASARNSTKHGLTARNPILLTVEDREAFDSLRDEYEHLFCPSNVVERQLVGEMVSVQWRRQRAEAIEAAQLNLTMDRMAGDIASRFTRLDDATRIALAWEHELSENHTLQSVQRIAERLSRQYLRLVRAFQDLRNNPIAPPPEEIRKDEPGEPQPAPSQADNVVEFPAPRTEAAPPARPLSDCAPNAPDTPASAPIEDEQNGMENH